MNRSLKKLQQPCKKLDITANETGRDFATFASYLGMKKGDLTWIRQSLYRTEKILRFRERKSEAAVDCR